MSAFIVEDKTINRVLWQVKHMRESHVFMGDKRVVDAVLAAAEINAKDPEWLEKLGASMAQMNADAVNYRYDESHEAAFSFRYEMCSNMQALKSLQCWLYQCSEGNVPDRALYKAFDGIEKEIALEIVRCIPAYEKCNWG